MRATLVRFGPDLSSKTSRPRPIIRASARASSCARRWLRGSPTPPLRAARRASPTSRRARIPRAAALVLRDDISAFRAEASRQQQAKGVRSNLVAVLGFGACRLEGLHNQSRGITGDAPGKRRVLQNRRLVLGWWRRRQRTDPPSPPLLRRRGARAPGHRLATFFDTRFAQAGQLARGWSTRSSRGGGSEERWTSGPLVFGAPRANGDRVRVGTPMAWLTSSASTPTLATRRWWSETPGDPDPEDVPSLVRLVRAYSDDPRALRSDR